MPGVIDYELSQGDQVRLELGWDWWSWFTIKRCRDGRTCRREGCGNEIEAGELYAFNNVADSQDAWRDMFRCEECVKTYILELAEDDD